MEPDAVTIDNQEAESGWLIYLILPIFTAAFFLYGILNVHPFADELHLMNNNDKNSVFNKEVIPFTSVLAANSDGLHLMDTVYTKDSLWLEMRIDKQMLYVHYRDGRVKSYPVSSGDGSLSKSIASRSGLFAVFYRTEVHYSSQFNNAQMNYFQAFNMGIGFHGLEGTSYYGYLGVRPSSHGCIRMRNDHVKELYKETKMGTLVLAHYGESARTIAFAPEGFENKSEYDKEDHMKILAHNLRSIYHGEYFIDPPIRFIVDPKQIPRNGFNLGDKKKISEKQFLPHFVIQYNQPAEKLRYNYAGIESVDDIPEDIAANFITSDKLTDELDLEVSKEHIDNLAFNKNGILPYFPPEKEYYSPYNFSRPVNTTTSTPPAEERRPKQEEVDYYIIEEKPNR